jgi:hypothetical protein
MKKIVGILLIGLLTACNNVVVTKQEEKAVGVVLDFYGGICNRKKGFHSKNGSKETYFELEMSQSEIIEQFSTLPALPASNIAYLFYSNLKNEQSNFTEIHVSIKLAKGETHKFIYKSKDLKEIENFKPIMEEVSNKIKSQDYDGLLLNFVKEVAKDFASDQIEKYCYPYDSAYGKVDKTVFHGFAFTEIKKYKNPVVHLVGFMKRKKQDVPISIIVDRKSKKIVALNYDL